MLKGWKTIIFNALMLIVGLTGAEVSADLAQAFTEEFIAVLTVGNGILRAITNGPIFNMKE